MSVIQSIRDRGTWIIFTIIAVALIAFILQDGVGRGGSAFSNTTTVGEVNGQKLERAAFEEKLAMHASLTFLQKPLFLIFDHLLLLQL